jgi:uncharacterized membrane protein
MKKNKQEVVEAEVEQEIVLSPRELKKQEREASAAKRRKARQKDKVARFSGIILLGMILFIGFLLWVAGEMRTEVPSLSQPTPTPFLPSPNSIRVR